MSFVSAPSAAPTSPPWETIEGLYRSSRDDLYSYLFTLLGERAVAEDVTELAFERAFRRWQSFDPGRGQPRQWLFGIARNAALDELRNRRRTTTLIADPQAADSEADHASQLADADERRERTAAVRGALAQLPDADRELIALKFQTGLHNREIAAVLGVSETNVGTLLYRAIQKLRRSLNV